MQGVRFFLPKKEFKRRSLTHYLQPNYLSIKFFYTFEKIHNAGKLIFFAISFN